MARDQTGPPLPTPPPPAPAATLPILSARGAAELARLDREYDRTRTRICMPLPHMHSPELHEERRPHSRATRRKAADPDAAFIAQLDDPEGDIELRNRLEEQRLRFDRNLQLPLQVRLMERQGQIDVRKPSAAFLDHLESGRKEVFGWTEQFTCPSPPRAASKVTSRNASQARLIGAATTAGKRTKKGSQLQPHSARASDKSRSKDPLQSTQNGDPPSADVSRSVSFAILPANQLPPVAASAFAEASGMQHDPSLSHFTETGAFAAPPLRNELSLKSGHGYLTGSQTARQPLSTVGASSTATLPVSTASAATLAPPLEHGRRWGGTATTSQSELTNGSQRVALRHSSSQQLPELKQARFLDTVVSIAADAPAGRAPNFYTPASLVVPFVASTFGLTTGRTPHASLEGTEDQTGPYSQIMSLEALNKHVQPHKNVASVHYRHPPTSTRPDKLAVKLESARYSIDRATLDLQAFRTTQVQPLSLALDKTNAARVAAAEVSGHGFNLSSALGGLLGGAGLASTGIGVLASRAHGGVLASGGRASKRMDSVGPGSYFGTDRELSTFPNHIPGPSYGPTGFADGHDERHSYLPVSCSGDNPFKHNQQDLKREVHGAVKMHDSTPRENLRKEAMRALNDPPSVGSYTLRSFPNQDPPSAHITTAHSQWGFTERFPSEERHRDDTHVREISRLLSDHAFAGVEVIDRFRGGTKQQADAKRKTEQTQKQSPKHTGRNIAHAAESKEVTPNQSVSSDTTQVPASSLNEAAELEAPAPSAQEAPTAVPAESSSSLHDLDPSSPAFAAQLATFGTLQPTAASRAAQADLAAKRKAVKEEALQTKRDAIAQQLVVAQAARESVARQKEVALGSLVPSAKEPQLYKSSLQQFDYKHTYVLRKKKKQEQHAKHTAVLERHRQIVEQKLGHIQSKILASDARLSHRLSGRSFSSRWFEVIALACTLRRWQDILGARRMSVLITKQQENAAILIQRAWRAHVSRMSDVKRTLSMAILRRNFRVLFFKHRIKRRILARRLITQFFKDVLRLQAEDSADGAAAAAVANKLGVDESVSDLVVTTTSSSPSKPGFRRIPSIASSRPAKVARYRRNTYNSVVAVIRHFKTQVTTIQRAVRKFLLLRGGQIDALVKQWDTVYERQRRLFVEASRKFKISDPHALQDHVTKDQARQAQIQHQHALHQKMVAEKAAAAAVAAAAEGVPPISDSAAARANRRRSGKSPVHAASTGAAASPPSAPAAKHTPNARSMPLSLDAPLADDESPTDDASALAASASDAAPLQPSALVSQRDGKKANKSPRTKAHGVNAQSSSNAHSRGASSPAVPLPPPPPVAAHPLLSYLPPAPSVGVPAYPQIFLFDRKFTDAEKRAFIHDDWKERRMKFVRSRLKYAASEEAYVRDQCRGITAAKRLLRHSAVSGTAVSDVSSDASALIVSRASASALFRTTHPPPTFRALLSPAAMIALINASLATRARRLRTTQQQHRNSILRISLQAERDVRADGMNKSSTRRRAAAHSSLLSPKHALSPTAGHASPSPVPSTPEAAVAE